MLPTLKDRTLCPFTPRIVLKRAPLKENSRVEVSGNVRSEHEEDSTASRRKRTGANSGYKRRLFEEDVEYFPSEPEETESDISEDRSQSGRYYTSEKQDETESNTSEDRPQIGKPTEEGCTDPVSRSEIFKKCDESLTTQSSHLASPQYVPTANKSNEKQYFCIYCDSKVTRFARHIQLKHRTEEKVAEILKLPTGDFNRTVLINEIRNMGTFKYNTDVVVNQGDLIVSRRPQKTKNRKAHEYIPCPTCKNFYKNNMLHRHYKKCSTGGYVPRTLQAQSRSLMIADQIDCPRLFKNIIPRLKQDEISFAAVNDKLVLFYGKYLCLKHEGETHLDKMIRQKLRMLGNFLLHIKKIDSSILALENIYEPKHFDSFVTAVKLCAGYNFDACSCRAPSLPSQLGILFKECADRLITESIKCDNEKVKYNAELWLTLYHKEFSIVCKVTNQMVKRRKWNKPRLIPTTEDICRLNMYLRNSLKSALDILSVQFDAYYWDQLSKYTFLSILIFNRRRVGEMEKLLILDFKKRHSIQKNSEVYKTLKPSERIFSQRYMRIEMRGKLARPVAILISHQEIDAINIILKYRGEAGVSERNPYVFGNCSAITHIEGTRILREAASACGAENPTLLRGTKLRKHIATVSQALSLTDNDLGILADFMGHNIDVHRDFYRLPSEALQLAKLSQLLVALDTNNIDKYRGKSLDEITMEVENTELSEEAEMSDVAAGEAETADVDILPSNITPVKGTTVAATCSTNTSPSSSMRTPEGKRRRFQWEPSTPGRIRKKVAKRSWNSAEINILKKHFKKHIQLRKLPSAAECRKLLNEETTVLHGRTHVQIKLWVNNYLKKA